jgi:hypothetical protein
MAISRRRVAVAVLVILGWAAAAHAEDAVQLQPAPAGTRTLAETPFRLILPQGHLFGDWPHGWRHRASRGEFRGGATKLRFGR